MDDVPAMVTSANQETVAELAPLDGFSAYLPLRVAVLTRLKAAILDGTLKPGTLLSENKIAAQLSVSRTPVREALRVLERENLVTTLPGRKVIISVPRAEDIDEIYDIRTIVESAALRRIGSNRRELIARLEQCLERSRLALAKRDIRELEQINTEFHTTIISALNNQRLREFIDSVHDTAARFRLYSLREAGWAEKGIQEHRRLVALLKKGDTEDAVELLGRHLRMGSEILKKMFHQTQKPLPRNAIERPRVKPRLIQGRIR